MNTNRIRSLKWLVWLLGFFLFLIWIVLPLLTSVLIQNNLMPRGFAKILDGIVQIQAWGLRLFTIAWIFFFGSCFASFLNVVAWRVPRGRSILGSSHCPYCNSKLAFKDNLPIVGWLRNAGRCRTCRLPISPRYLVAEVLLGSIFLLLAFVQLNGGGINLPFRPTNVVRGFENLLFEPKWDLLLLLFYYLTLLSSLFTFSLVKSDGLTIPASLFLIPLLLGIGLPLLWPEMSLVNWQNGYEGAATIHLLVVPTWTTSLMGGVAGFVVGWLLGSLINRVSFPDQTPNQFAIGMSVVGVFLGWQSVLSVSIIYSIFTIVLKILSSRLRPNSHVSRYLNANPFAKLLLATLVHLLSWRAQTAIPYWLTLDHGWTTLIVGIPAFLVLLFAVMWFHSIQDRSDRSVEIGHE